MLDFSIVSMNRMYLLEYTVVDGIAEDGLRCTICSDEKAHQSARYSGRVSVVFPRVRRVAHVDSVNAYDRCEAYISVASL